jgi:hypothetical protein
MSDPIHSITIQDDTTPEVVATIEVSPPAGNDGWSPVFAVVSDGTRRVLQVSDWVGGEGTKPATGKYVGASGLVDAVGDGVDIRGPQGAQGTTGSTGATGAAGADGDDGWTPVFAVVTDGARRVLQVSDWVGGEGTKPATGKYVGASGLVDAVGDGVDIRGATGPQGDPGDAADIAAEINGATEKTTPVDNDRFGITDSEDSYGLKRLSWANIKATLKTWLEALTDLTLKRLSIAQGSISTAATGLDLSATWNNNAETFRGADIAISKTAAAAASTPLRVRSDSFALLEVFNDGVEIGGNNPTPSSGGGRNPLVIKSLYGNLQFFSGGANNWNVQNLDSVGGPYNRLAVKASDMGADLFALYGQYGVQRLLELREVRPGTGDQVDGYKFAVYAAHSSGLANYERLMFDISSSGFLIKPEAGGTGTARNVEYHLTASGVRLIAGSGSPEGVVSAPVGTIYSRTDGGTGASVYLKEAGTGNTGWVAVASGASTGWQLLSTTTISGTPANADVVFSGTHRKYMLELEDFYCAASGYALYMQTSTNGGSTFDDSANAYGWGRGPLGSFGPATGTATYIDLLNLVGNSAEKGVTGEIIIYDPTQAKKVSMDWKLARTTFDAATRDIWVGTAYRDAAADVNAVRFFFSSSQNIGGGKIRLYGWND